MMQLVRFILDIDEHLQRIVAEYGGITYAILFVIILVETGLVLMPFLPGDSLLFAAGALAGAGHLEVAILLFLLSIAAIVGDTINYAMGRWIGPRMPFLKKEHLAKTQSYFDRFGGKTIVLARFIPIVRTFAPFVAGMGAMNYSKFIFYNVVGAIAWVAICVLAGYFFGGLEIVKKNFEIVIVAIILISVVPMAWEIFSHWRINRKTDPKPTE